MTVRTWIVVLLTLTGFSNAQGPAAEAPDRPNIILVLIDDLGWQDASVPMQPERIPFNDRYKTPNLERLAARGVRFSNAYASAPVCTPTRTSILTGRTPARTHITYWTLNKDTDTSRQREDIAAPAWEVNGLQPGQYETLPQRLAEAGYRTIHIGKAHFGAHDTPGADPVNLGFEVNIAGHASGGPASYYGLHHFTASGRQGKPPHATHSVWDIPGVDKYHGHDIYLTEALAIEASEQIRRAAAEGVPIFMNFAPYAVHAPIMPNKKYQHLYPDLDKRESAYASMIQTVDAALGAIVAALDETGQLENTIIVFASDNGGLSAHARGRAPDGQTKHTHNAPLRSGKGSAYEGGTRVPLVIAWPGVTDRPGVAGTIIDTPVISQDFYPTFLARAGLGPTTDLDIDGRDLTPLLTGQSDLFDDSRVLGWNQPHQWGASGPGIWPFTSIRVDNWKLIYFHAQRRFELYNLMSDLGETNDLAQSQPEKVVELAAIMDQWLEDTGGQLSIDKATGKSIDRPGQAAIRWAEQHASNSDTPTHPPVTMQPTPSTETRTQSAGWGNRSWLDQFEDIRAAAHTLEPHIVLIGDSITQGFGGAERKVGGGGTEARKLHLDPLGQVLNAGISGDRTQHVLWRLDHGMLDGSNPDLIFLMIGTNNLPHDSATEIAHGIEAILTRLKQLTPGSRLILVSVPPRGRQAMDPLRVKGAKVNAIMQNAAERLEVEFLSLDPILLDLAGQARPELMAGDFIHFSPAGYDAVAKRFADAIKTESP
jgi:arylsulfatase A-like enzyme/lysophospholipase L1-like esterase